jgi:hypothetical protein
VPVAAVADTVIVSAAFLSTSAIVVDDPLKVWVAVNVLVTAVPGTAKAVRASEAVVDPVPPLAIAIVVPFHVPEEIVPTVSRVCIPILWFLVEKSTTN